MKALFIGRDYSTLDDGGKIVTKRNCDFLKKICTHVDEILRPRGNIRTFVKNILLHEGYGYTTEMRKRFFDLIKTEKYDFVWLDGSCDSSIATECKKLEIPIICFYHNIETVFYKSKAINSNSVLDKIFAKYIHSIEHRTSKLAEIHIFLNERDSSQATKIYNVRSNLILPTSFPVIDSVQLKQNITSESYILFVGSNFWANIEGLNYLFEKIAPHVNIKIKIVGSICNAFKDRKLPNNVSLEGRVEDLKPYYINALAVISPILSGSGTKTKTIEALRYGKTIIGSPEALMGVPEEYYSGIGTLCTDSKDYIKAINELTGQKFNTVSYEVFYKIFSNEAVFNKLKRFLETNILENETSKKY